MHNARPYLGTAFRRPFSGLACACFGALLLPVAGFASSPDPLSDTFDSRAITRAGQPSSREFLAELQSAFAQATPDTLPQQVASAIQARPELAAKITAEAVRVIANGGSPGDALRCASVEQIISAAISTRRDSAVAITRKTVAAAPAYRDCIVSAATAQAAELRMAFLRAARQGEVMHAVLARIAERNGEAGAVNPANVAGNGNGNNVRSPEQPPNNPPNGNNPPNNNPPNHPPNVPRPRGNRGPHSPPTHAP